MGDAAPRRATYQDVLEAPAHRVAEVLFGVLHTFPRPAPRHAVASSALGGELSGPFQRGRGGPGGWVILDEPELHLGEDILVPDLSGWRRERMPEVPVDDAFFSLSPDWCCEVLSPSTQAIDRSDKMDVYLRERVRHVWHVEPIGQTLEVFEIGEGEWRRIASWRGDAKVRAKPFDAIELDLAVLWAR